MNRNPDDFACDDLVELVTDYLEGALPAEVRALCDGHLAECPHCRAYLEQMRATIRLLGRAIEETVPLDTRALLLQRFREWAARPG